MLIITGTGRSGTGMLARAFGGFHEFRVTGLLDRIGRKKQGASPFETVESRLGAVLYLHQGVNRTSFVDASNLYIHLIDALWDLYPEIRILLAVRNGRDVARSAILRGWHQRTSFDVLPPCGSPFRKRWEGMGSVARAAFIWTHRNRMAMDALEALPRECWTTVRIEDLDERGFDRLSAFSGIPVRDRAAVSAGINANRQGPPADWTQEEETDFIAIAGDMMRRFGYS